ncbi:hypothetical protein KW803_02970 [Candidatus Saccharibacteria bacterium]|nr:hypothetical protein [Candidatus Saccharibacteria bacterium]
MNRNGKAMMAAMAAGVSIGYMAAKKQYDNKRPYRKFLDKIEEYMD